MALAMLCSNQLMYASAVSASGYEYEAMPRFVIAQEATSGDATVTFNFNYSDGNSVECIAVFIAKDSNY